MGEARFLGKQDAQGKTANQAPLTDLKKQVKKWRCRGGCFQRPAMNTCANISGPLPQSPTRAEVLEILEGHNDQAQVDLASHPDAAPEVLYYLATKGSVPARRAVAAKSVHAATRQPPPGRRQR